MREVIRELADQGILINRPYRDLRVRPVSAKDLEELYSLRTALEQFAFRLSWPGRSTEALRELEERHNALIESHEANDDPAATNERELAFHSRVCELAGHTLLLSHWRRLVPLVQIYMSLHYRTHGAHGEFRHMTTEYLRFAGGDSLDAMCEHIHEHVKQGLASVMAEWPASAVSPAPNGTTRPGRTPGLRPRAFFRSRARRVQPPPPCFHPLRWTPYLPSCPPVPSTAGRRSHPSRYRRRKSALRTLPMALFGRASTKRYRRGTL